MSKKADYAAEEWQTIVKAAPMAGLDALLARKSTPDEALGFKQWLQRCM